MKSNNYAGYSIELHETKLGRANRLSKTITKQLSDTSILNQARDETSGLSRHFIRRSTSCLLYNGKSHLCLEGSKKDIKPTKGIQNVTLVHCKSEASCDAENI